MESSSTNMSKGLNKQAIKVSLGLWQEEIESNNQLKNSNKEWLKPLNYSVKMKKRDLPWMFKFKSSVNNTEILLSFQSEKSMKRKKGNQ